MKRLLLILLAVQVGGCGAISQQKTNALLKVSKPADWGVLDRNHESKERAAILQELKDPDSAKFRFNVGRDVYQALSEPVLVWNSSVYVNAKNSFGGYTGERAYVFIYKCPIGQTCELLNYARPNSRYPDELDWVK